MKNIYNIVHLSSRLVSAADRFIERALNAAGYYDISPADGDILFVLYQHDGLIMSDLAKAAGRTKSTITTLVSGLEKKGYIVKEPMPGNARATKICLTQKARDVEPVFCAISECLNSRMTASMASYEVQMLSALLQKSVDNLK